LARRHDGCFAGERTPPSFPVLAYDREAADWHASERIRLGPAVTPPLVDGQIAAIAMVNGLTLVTDNVVDFRCFEGLRLGNWVERAPTP
jgi:tRNA(fMet)-specific endonuclease VapC